MIASRRIALLNVNLSGYDIADVKRARVYPDFMNDQTWTGENVSRTFAIVSSFVNTPASPTCPPLSA